MFPLPPPIVAAMSEGVGYNDAFEAAGVPPDPTGDGVVGVLSGGLLTRPAQMRESVDNAMLQLQNPALWGEKTDART